MRTSDQGLLEICEHEGIVPGPYLDSNRVWTFGIGHTSGAGAPYPAQMKRGMPDDLDAAILRAVELFRDDLEKYEARVNDAIKVPLAQHQFDALVSFDFNTGGIYKARLTRAINDAAPTAARYFMGWLRPPEIRGRRMAEMRLFQTGDYAANGDAIPIWRVDATGRLRGILRNIDGADVLAMLGRSNRAALDAGAFSRGVDRVLRPTRTTRRPGGAGILTLFRRWFG